MQGTLKILVIVPVYNVEKYLAKCLDSIIAQSYCNWEAFVIDDASTDNSNLILTQYAKKDNRIKVYRNKVNKGPGSTRNLALELACNSIKSKPNTGMEYVVFIDSDDWIEENYFETINKIANKEDADVIFVDVVQEDTFGKVIKYERMSAYMNQSKDTIIRHQMTGKLPWGGCRKSVKAELIFNNDIKYSKDDMGEEAIYSFRLLYNSKKIAFIKDALYHYVIHPNSQSATRDDDPYDAVCSKMKCYLEEAGLYNQYRYTHASFAYRALIVSIYRKTQYYCLTKAIKDSKLALKKFKSNYEFLLDKDSLENKTRFLLPFAKWNMVFPIVIAAKIKSMNAYFQKKAK